MIVDDTIFLQFCNAFVFVYIVHFVRVMGGVCCSRRGGDGVRFFFIAYFFDLLDIE